MVTKVSVVLPTYNRAACLERAVRSVLDQSFTDLELIVVDDGSTDGSVDALQQVIRDPRLRCLRTTGRRGPGAARNLGVADAGSDWIAFQDSDDLWRPDKLERQWEFHLAHPTLDLIACDVQVHNLAGSPSWRSHNNFARLTSSAPDVLLRPLRFPTPTWLVRRAALLAIGGFDETLPSVEDWDVCLHLADHGSMGGLGDCLVHKFESSGSVYGSPLRRHQGIRQLLQRHCGRWQTAAGREALHQIALSTSQAMLLHRERRLALWWAWAGFRAQPANTINLMLVLSALSGKRFDLRWQSWLAKKRGSQARP